MVSWDIARLCGGLGGLYGIVAPDPSMRCAEKGKEELVSKRGQGKMEYPSKLARRPILCRTGPLGDS